MKRNELKYKIRRGLAKFFAISLFAFAFDAMYIYAILK